MMLNNYYKCMDYNNLIIQFNPKEHKMEANQIQLPQCPPAHCLKA